MISNSNRVWMKVVPGIAGIISLSAALSVPSWAGESRPITQVVEDSLVSQAESGETPSTESVDPESIEMIPSETESVEVESVDVPMSDDEAMESESSEVEMPGVESLEIDASETEVLPDASEAGEIDENVEATEVEEDSLLQSPTMEETSPDISTNELQQFAATIPHLVTIEQTGQEQISQAIDQSGLERDRFYEIYQSQEQPTSGSANGVATPEEQSSFETALAQIEAIEQDVASQQQDVIAASGLAPERFNEIMDTVLNDPQLQLEVQDLMVQ
ncbi:MAG: DUF4168 domain-containing protein [Synechococcales cyanobacterium T60_A2020_003]|nr:DUF4168 domain-containing protein [Synechococcales cyanobacterium T60_A2020_003]